MTKRSIMALLGAAAMVAQPVTAAAQANCLDKQELSAMVVYAMPSMVRAVQLRCGATLSPQGFLVQQGPALAARYAALQPQTWPQARAGLLKLATTKANERSEEMASMFATLPGEAVGPLIDALIVQELSPEIPIEDCGSIEQVVETVAPLQPADLGNLLAVIASVVVKDDALFCPLR